MRVYPIFILMLTQAFMLLTASAQKVQCITYEPKDSLLIVKLLQQRDSTVLAIARNFLGQPYVAHTLEVNDDERLVVNTRQLDCTTFVETVTALMLCKQRGLTTFSHFAAMLQKLRYRDGTLCGYPSRLHYFTEWITDNQHKALITEIQQPLTVFTAKQRISVNYMTTHPSSYQALRLHPELLPIIHQQEERISGQRFLYIPKSQVRNTQLLRSVIHDGDILAITCSKPGLDIAHLGFAVWHTDGLHLLNASQLHHKVVEEPMTLYQYLQKHPTHTGIRVIRINTTKRKSKE